MRKLPISVLPKEPTKVPKKTTLADCKVELNDIQRKALSKIYFHDWTKVTRVKTKETDLREIHKIYFAIDEWPNKECMKQLTIQNGYVVDFTDVPN